MEDIHRIKTDQRCHNSPCHAHSVIRLNSWLALLLLIPTLQPTQPSTKTCVSACTLKTNPRRIEAVRYYNKTWDYRWVPRVGCGLSSFPQMSERFYNSKVDKATCIVFRSLRADLLVKCNTSISSMATMTELSGCQGQMYTRARSQCSITSVRSHKTSMQGDSK